MSTHRTPEAIRKNLTHPVVDSDGHWIQYTPVFAEKMRKVVGDLGADGFFEGTRVAKEAAALLHTETPSRAAA